MSTANVTQTGQAATVTVTVSRGIPGSDANVTNANVNAAIEASPGTTRTSLGLGTAATSDTGDFASVTHATQHGIGGADPIAPGDIGAAAEPDSAKSTAPVDADRLYIYDSEAGNVPKTSLWSIIKSTLKTYFDSFYETPAGAAAQIDEAVSIELLEDFSRYTAGTGIANDGTKFPLIGSTAWRIAQGASPPTVDNGDFGSLAVDNWYLSNFVETRSGRASMGVESQARSGATAFNISISPRAMVTLAGAIDLPGIVHINLDSAKILTCDYYFGPAQSSSATNEITATAPHYGATGTPFITETLVSLPTGMSPGTYYMVVTGANTFKVATTLQNALDGITISIGTTALAQWNYKIVDLLCVNRPGTSQWRFHPDQTLTEQNFSPLTRVAVLVEVDGEFLHITMSRVGSVIFHSPSLARKFAASPMYFWVENGWPSRIWGNAPSLDTQISRVTDPYFCERGTIPGRLKSAYRGGSLITGNSTVGVPYNERQIANSFSTKSLNGATPAVGGNMHAQGAYTSRVGGLEDISLEMVGRAPMVVRSKVLTQLSSATTGSAVQLVEHRNQNVLEPGDRIVYQFEGVLIAGVKRLYYRDSNSVNTMFDFTLDAYTGNFLIDAVIKQTSASNQTVHARLTINGVGVASSRAVFTSNSVTRRYRLFVVQDTASCVAIDDIRIMQQREIVLADA